MREKAERVMRKVQEKRRVTNRRKLDLDCNNVKPRLDNENGWISMRNDF